MRLTEARVKKIEKVHEAVKRGQYGLDELISAVPALLKDRRALLEELQQCGWRTDLENAPRGGAQVLAWGSVVDHVKSCVERAEVVFWSRRAGRWIDPAGFIFEPVAYKVITPPTMKGARR